MFSVRYELYIHMQSTFILVFRGLSTSPLMLPHILVSNWRRLIKPSHKTLKTGIIRSTAASATTYATKQHRQCTYDVTEARSCNHCWSGKAVSIEYSECALVALGIQHAIRMRHIVICCPSCSTIFLHVISQMAKFSKKENLMDKKNHFYLL